MTSLCRLLMLAAAAPLIGCSFGYDPSPPPKSAASPKTSAPSPTAPSSSPQAGPGHAAAPSSAVPAPGPSPGRSPAAGPTMPPGQALPVRLSAGTALPQTLPDGTVVGFSVDYQFTAGQPEPNAQYFWVIERAQGPPAKQPVRLKAQGTLQGFSDFRPEHGPFQTHLEDARGNRLSANEPLR